MTPASQPVVRLTTRLETLWQDYLAAKAIAEKTGQIADGMVAGRAWARWLAEFVRGGRTE